MITREQVADLRPGDFVELSWHHREHDEITVTARGNLRAAATALNADGALFLGGYCVRNSSGDPVYGERRSLTVVTRVPRPLYANHSRMEPVNGDVASQRAVSGNESVSICFIGGRWQLGNGWTPVVTRALTLLVDGETGQVVQ